ncbi:tRNA(fMet)-specific endonuclease VapC [archaeon HR01]|nr:tRNA(fMet)-specific endonuclease VapC [archaeon HR01]
MTQLIDTSVLIKRVKEKKPVEGKISVITLIEMLRGIPGSKRGKLKKTIEEGFTVVEITNDVILEYCELYDKLKEKGQIMNDADLLLAASAKASGIPLITSDNGFKRLENLGIKIIIEE